MKFYRPIHIRTGTATELQDCHNLSYISNAPIRQ